MPTVCQALTGCWEYGKRGQDTITCGTGTLVGETVHHKQTNNQL